MQRMLLGCALALAALATTPALASAELAKKYNCSACHVSDKKLVGPGWQEVAAKYQAQGDAAAKLAAKVKAGGKGVWGPVPMPPNPTVPEADLATLVAWVLAGGK